MSISLVFCANYYTVDGSSVEEYAEGDFVAMRSKKSHFLDKLTC